MEAELRTVVNPVMRSSPAGRLRSRVPPQPLANCLGPLVTEANIKQHIPSYDVRERRGTAPAPRGRRLENRTGSKNGPQQVALREPPAPRVSPSVCKGTSAQGNSQADLSARVPQQLLSLR